MSALLRLGLNLGAGLWLATLACAAAPGTDLRVLDARTPATGAGSAVVYLSVHNTGGQDDRLLSASSPVARRVEIRALTGSRAAPQRMRSGGVELPIGGSIDFVSGGLQLHLIGLRRPLVMGQHFALRLKFRQAGELTTSVLVVAAETWHPPRPAAP